METDEPRYNSKPAVTLKDLITAASGKTMSFSDTTIMLMTADGDDYQATSVRFERTDNGPVLWIE